MIVIAIPALPPKEASPNWRGGHWAVKAKAVRQHRQLVYLCALSERNRTGRWKALDGCNISATFYVKNSRYVMDDDNARATLKPAIDALVDAGIVAKNDRKVKVTEVSFIPRSPRAPSVVLEIAERDLPPIPTNPVGYAEP